MRTIIFSITLITITFSGVWGQKNHLKFGNIPIEEMKMTEYEPDPSAPAVVLLSTGVYQLRDYNFYVHKRIKILKQSGTEYGNFTLRVPNKGMIKASCFNLENGEIVEYKLKKSEMIEEEITDDLIVYKLFLPNVKVGSVVELEYSHKSLPFAWNFQEMIPVKYTELVIVESNYFIFDVNHYGNLQLNHLGGYHWLGTDLPAFKPEPMMASINNNMRRVEFELEEVFIPGVYYKEYSTTWGKVSKRLLDLDRFGGILKSGSSYLNDKGNELKKLSVSDEEKIQLAYNYIREQIEWNGDHGIFATADYRSNFTKDHSGNVAEINLNLIALLNKANVEAHPVVLSTKANGYLKKYKPTENKLNYVVCLAKVGDKSILIDAASKNTVIGVLPPKCLNGDGWVVTKGEYNEDVGWGYWIALEPEGMTFEQSFAQVEINEDGSSHAKVMKKQNLYDYLSWKDDFDKMGSEAKCMKALDDKYGDVVVLDYAPNIDVDKMTVREIFDIDISSKLEDFGDEIIINPFVFSYDIENPFKSDERLSPVDLGYKHGMSRKIMIKLPEFLSVGIVPENMSMTTDDGKAQFAFEVVQDSNNLTLSYSMIVKDPKILQQDYPVLKGFYSLMIDKLNESITLKRRT